MILLASEDGKQLTCERKKADKKKKAGKKKRRKMHWQTFWTLKAALRLSIVRAGLSVVSLSHRKTKTELVVFPVRSYYDGRYQIFEY